MKTHCSIRVLPTHSWATVGCGYLVQSHDLAICSKFHVWCILDITYHCCQNIKAKHIYPSYPSPPFVFTACNFVAVYQKLTEHHLVFDLTMPGDMEHPWHIINDNFLAHCVVQGLHLHRKEGDNGQTFNSLSWDLLTQGAVWDGVIMHYKMQPCFAAGFSTAHLWRMAVVDPETAQSKSLLILCKDLNIHSLFIIDKRLDLIKSHISKDAHPCFAWCIFAGRDIVLLQWPKAQEHGTCLSGICPTKAPHAETDDVAGSVSCLAL